MVNAFGPAFGATQTMPWPGGSGTLAELLDWLQRLGIKIGNPWLVALYVSVGTIGGDALPPDPEKCPKDFWRPDHAPQEGWQWQAPVGNQRDYWYNPTAKGQRLSPDLQWDREKPPHWDYTDPLGGQWECDQNGTMHKKGEVWWP